MRLLDIRESVKIASVNHMQWNAGKVSVAPRPHHALAFRIKGNATFTHGDKTVISTPGTVTYMPANYDYGAEYPDKNEILVIHFYVKKDLEIENFTPVSSPALLALFKNAHKVWNEGKSTYYHKTMSIFYEILSVLSTNDVHFQNSASYKSFLSAVEFMREHYTDSALSIEALTKSANISGTYFRKLFTEIYGESPSKYLTGLRLQHAENLLMSGNYTVNEVALQSGFSDPKYFSRVVKRVYGYPPSHLYR